MSFPQLDDSTVARELAITDSEHSDAEVSCTDNGTFNLSRGQTPLTEGSEGERNLGPKLILALTVAAQLCRQQGHYPRLSCFPSCGLGGGAASGAWLQPDGTAAPLEVLSRLVASGSKLMGDTAEKGEVLWPVKVTTVYKWSGKADQCQKSRVGNIWLFGADVVGLGHRKARQLPCLRHSSVLPDLDGHSDPEESFARDLPDFPSINVDPAGLDDEDDTSIGMPSLMYRVPPGAEESQGPPASREEAALPELLLGALPAGSNLTSNLASLVSQGMIQLALSGASQPGPSGLPPRRATRGVLRAPSSDLDTDAEGDDFELLDQSELNQLDPASSRSH